MRSWSAAGPTEGPDLTARVGDVVLRNPVMTASGTAGVGAELAAYLDPGALGAVVVKSLSATAWPGNPAPRLVPVAAGLLNGVGLHNPGVPAWLDDHLPALAGTGAAVVASVWGSTADQYREAAALLASAPADGPRRAVRAVEVNVSCPNLEDRSRVFANAPDTAAAAVAAAVDGLRGSGLPVWAKLSPNVTDLVAIAGAVLDAGAAGLTLVNTLMGLAVDPSSGTLRPARGGGLSGPALHPVAVRAVYECRAAWPHAPIVGVGGVGSGRDAAELLAAGADAVQVGTATFAEPTAAARILAELRHWCRHHGVQRLDQLKGRAHA
ncbi:MAG TPA: dihydroorotate dehydrogenase [Acidimicrobiales bacterium]|nr:dihydroorotate dehydrogenase [Acidimicrobiales bacterium]